MPGQDANRIIRALKKAYPQLDNPHRAERVVEAVRSAFEERQEGAEAE